MSKNAVSAIVLVETGKRLAVRHWTNAAQCQSGSTLGSIAFCWLTVRRHDLPPTRTQSPAVAGYPKRFMNIRLSDLNASCDSGKVFSRFADTCSRCYPTTMFLPEALA